MWNAQLDKCGNTALQRLVHKSSAFFTGQQHVIGSHQLLTGRPRGRQKTFTEGPRVAAAFDLGRCCGQIGNVKDGSSSCSSSSPPAPNAEMSPLSTSGVEPCSVLCVSLTVFAGTSVTWLQPATPLLDASFHSRAPRLEKLRLRRQTSAEDSSAMCEHEPVWLLAYTNISACAGREGGGEEWTGGVCLHRQTLVRVVSVFTVLHVVTFHRLRRCLYFAFLFPVSSLSVFYPHT